MAKILVTEGEHVSKMRILTEMQEVEAIRLHCTKCGAALEIPAETADFPSHCPVCETIVAEDCRNAGQFFLRGLQAYRRYKDRDLPMSKAIEIQFLTEKEN
jgi:predicted RNA-binding Zn-ribbon protein involved in translation (DUF1610 family)